MDYNTRQFDACRYQTHTFHLSAVERKKKERKEEKKRKEKKKGQKRKIILKRQYTLKQTRLCCG